MRPLRSLVAGVLASTCALGAGSGIDRAQGGAAAAPAATPVRLEAVILLVADQDKALQWYTEKLGFEKKVDQPMGPGQRWLTIVPKGQIGPEIVLQKATAAEEAQIGKSLEWVFDTDDAQKAYDVLSARGVKFAAPPNVRPWGTQVRFEDLYGNHFTLVSAPPHH
jgi:predicted enzyme related to lactoylglutathione lyase